MKKYVKDLKFAQILRNRKINTDLVKIFQNAYTLNRKLFKNRPKKFKIIVCDIEKEFKKEAKYYYFKHGTATVLRNNNLITRSPEFVEKIGRWKRKDYQNLMHHEMNHVFWRASYHLTKPSWLLEGLACHVGNNFILNKKKLKEMIIKYKVNSTILDYRYLKRNFDRGHIPKYPIWANFTDYITTKYSVNKIIKLMNKYSKKPIKSNYNITLKNTFGQTQKQMFNEFINSIKS